jgi:hypothetical protein
LRIAPFTGWTGVNVPPAGPHSAPVKWNPAGKLSLMFTPPAAALTFAILIR